MFLGPILGDEKCLHQKLVYYHSGYSGNYAVCQTCGGHFWGDTEEGISVPEGVHVVDVDHQEDDEEADDGEEISSAPKADKERLQEWKRGVQGW